MMMLRPLTLTSILLLSLNDVCWDEDYEVVAYKDHEHHDIELGEHCASSTMTSYSR